MIALVAARASKPARPAQLDYEIATGLLVTKPVLKRLPSSRILPASTRMIRLDYHRQSLYWS